MLYQLIHKAEDLRFSNPYEFVKITSIILFDKFLLLIYFALLSWYTNELLFLKSISFIIIIELETIFDESITQYNNRQPITPLDKDTLEKAYISLIQNKHRILQFKIKTKQTETTSRTSTNSFYLALGGSYWMLMNYPTNGYSARPKYLSIFSGTYYYIS